MYTVHLDTLGMINNSTCIADIVSRQLTILIVIYTSESVLIYFH
jgi:hypothetical protein